jgi:hypothetical protein
MKIPSQNSSHLKNEVKFSKSLCDPGLIGGEGLLEEYRYIEPL